MSRRVLLIAYHFPPVSGSSGVHRTLKFSQYLPEFGWKPTVLSVCPCAYEQTTQSQMHQISDRIQIVRAFGLDTARHLAIKGVYFSSFALPDRWVTWWFGGVLSGLNVIRKQKPSVIWSTYPIATAHLIGLTLHKLTGLPWIADFRDSMTEESYPSNRRKRQIYLWIERKVVENCTYAVFTTSGAKQMYADRYPHIPSSRWIEIANGYDEDSFRDAEASLVSRGDYADKAVEKKSINLIHSGILYPSERDPTAFFTALAELRDQGDIKSGEIKIILRGTAHDEIFRPMISELGLNQIVYLEPPVPYVEALSEMISTDGLLLFQASNCNHQIPAKVYEYIRAKRPVFSLTDPIGNTATLLDRAGLSDIAPLNDKDAIKPAFLAFLTSIKCGSAMLPGQDVVNSFSRRSRTAELANLLNDIDSDEVISS